MDQNRDQNDTALRSHQIREVSAAFHEARRFEDAVDRLEDSGFARDALNLVASHDAVSRKLAAHYAPARPPDGDDRLPQAIFEDRRAISGDKRLAVGLPVYIGGAGAGLAVVATGGTLAFAALIAAAGAAAGAGIGSLIAHAVGEHHARLLARELGKGALIVTVQVNGPAQEQKALSLLQEAGGAHVTAHTLTRYEAFDRMSLPFFDPYDWPGHGF